MSEPIEPRQHVEVGAERLEAFSDAVMAVIITLLAFQLDVPDGPHIADLQAALPKLLIYVLAFVFIAIYWNNHHHLLRATTRISGAVMWANMFLLFWLSLIPVLTRWLKQDPREPFPVACFGIVALFAALAYAALVRALVRANGRESLVGVAVSSDLKGNISLVMYAAGVALSFVSIWIAYALYAAVAVMWLIPDRRFVRAHPADHDHPTT